MTGRLRARARRARGFTLIELLVALTLLGLIAVALFGGLRFGARAWEAGNERAEGLAEIDVAQGFLRRHLAQASVPLSSAQGARGPTVIAGTREGMRFVAPVAPQFGVGGLYLLDLAAVEEDGDKRLQVAWQLYRPDGEDRGPAEDDPLSGVRTLLAGVEDVSFAYYGVVESDSRPDWHEAWEDGTRLPDLVAVDVVFPAGDRRAWPQLVVALRRAAARGEP